jgi:hypothetical protein
MNEYCVVCKQLVQGALLALVQIWGKRGVDISTYIVLLEGYKNIKEGCPDCPMNAK